MSQRTSKRRAASVASVVSFTLALAIPMAGFATTYAGHEPNGAASCMGIEHAAISPPGTSDEEPGGSRQFVGEVKALAAGLGGVPAGALMRFIASLHVGSHEDCDEALGG